MEIKNGSICELQYSGVRIVGSDKCKDCLFNNDTYNPPEGYQYCVFPYSKDDMKEGEANENN